jgi:hypothetical protein
MFFVRPKMAAARRLSTFKISGEPSKFTCHALSWLMLCLGAFTYRHDKQGGFIWLLVYLIKTQDLSLQCSYISFIRLNLMSFSIASFIILGRCSVVAIRGSPYAVT